MIKEYEEKINEVLELINNEFNCYKLLGNLNKVNELIIYRLVGIKGLYDDKNKTIYINNKELYSKNLSIILLHEYGHHVYSEMIKNYKSDFYLSWMNLLRILQKMNTLNSIKIKLHNKYKEYKENNLNINSSEFKNYTRRERYLLNRHEIFARLFEQ